MVSHLSVVLPVNTLEGAKSTTAHRGVNWVVACGHQSCVGCRGVYPSFMHLWQRLPSCLRGLQNVKMLVMMAVMELSSQYFEERS